MVNRQMISLVARWTPRYIGVSIFCFLFNNLLLVALDRAGTPLWLTVLVSAATMILVGFALQALITFSVPWTRDALGRYALALSPNIPIAYLLLWLLQRPLGLEMHWAAPVVTTVMFLWNAVGSAWALHARGGTQA